MPTSKPWTRTPPEIWQEILKLSISLPLFLSVDPASYGFNQLYKYGDLSAYWESERSRNRLRRVQSSWDVYLRRFSHRFVDLVDVEHGLVPPSAIRCAIRIQLTRCFCSKRVVDLSEMRESLDKIREDGTPEPWKLEMLLATWPDWGDRLKKHWRLFTHSHRLANLVVLFNVTEDLWTTVDELRCRLTFCTRQCELRGALPRDLSYLTTLSLYKHDRSELPLSMPCLRHLKIWMEAKLDLVGNFVEWLRKIGPQLESLIWDDDDDDDDRILDLDIWQLCPNLTTLRSPVYCSIPFPPKNGHPIEHFILTYQYFKFGDQECPTCKERHGYGYIEAPPISSFASAGIKTLQLELPWVTFPQARMSARTSYTLNEKLCLHAQTRIHGITLVDQDRSTFEDVVIRLLEVRSGIRKRFDIGPKDMLFF